MSRNVANGNESPDIVVIGAGFSGLAVGHELKARGYSDFILAESGESLGGVWRDNHYPNAACDTPVDVYSFSFHRKVDWSCNFAPASELLTYAHEIADKFGLREHIRYSTHIVSAIWDAARKRWDLETSDGRRWSPRFLIWGGGRLSQPLIPDLPGLADFQGKAFHSTAWPEDDQIEGRRVALIGAGATSMQVLPDLAQRAAHCYAFMRSPTYVFPKPMEYYTEEDWRARRDDPAIMDASTDKWTSFLEQTARDRFPMNEESLSRQEAAWREFFESQVKDPVLREVLTPDHRVGCRRQSYSDEYYPSLCQDNVTVLSTGLKALTPSGVVTDDGRSFEVDTVVFATGFRATEMVGALDIRGRDGVRLADQWREVPEAYLGVMAKNFPNLFFVNGPNAELSSATIAIETHSKYIVSCIATMDENRQATIEVRPEVQEAFIAEVIEMMDRSVMVRGGCRSWHKVGGTGRVFTYWPGTPSYMRQRMAVPAPEDFILGEYEGELVPG